jgi:hypothetical protein
LPWKNSAFVRWIPSFEITLTDFNSIFPNFVNQCVQLKQLLTPIAFLPLTAGLISSIVTGQKSGDANAS